LRFVICDLDFAVSSDLEFAVYRSCSIPPKKDQSESPTQSQSWQQDEDVQLMLRFKMGDRQAFDQLVERNTPKVHALVFRFLGDAGQVEDLTQEVFLRIYRTAWRYKPTARFSTWLYRIAANLSFNVIRSRKKGQLRQIKAAEGEESETFTQELPDLRHKAPHERMDDDELRRKIAEAVNNLPESQKIAIILNKYENKSYDEIAEVLDCSMMAVKSLLSRARGNLHEALARYRSKG
jgi:RNA polymerase sigma-70 factor, ECF subfamily